MMTTKSPEQLQKEAEQNGTLTTWHEFTWSYPWHRTHSVGEHGGQKIIDVGHGLLSFGDSFDFPYSPWKNKITEWFSKIMFSVVLGIGATELALWLLSHAGPIFFGIALFTYIGYKSYSLFIQNWNSIEGLWVSLVSTVVSIEISIWRGVSELIPFIFHALIAGTAAVKSLTWGFLCKLIMVPINIWLLIMACARLASLGAL